MRKIPSIKKIKIKVIGIGAGGSTIVSEIAKNIKKASFVVTDCDKRILKKGEKNIKVIQLGEDISHGLGTGINPILGEEISRKEKEKITKILKNQDLLILIACLGGGFGSGATPVFAELSKNFKNISLGIFTLPFKFEGEKKTKIAKEALEKIKENLSGTFIVSNEKIFQVIDKHTPFKKALSILNKNLILILKDLIELISKTGVINIDFADLRTILKGRGQIIYVGSIICSGPNRTEEAIKKVFQSPFYGGAAAAFFCKNILFNISGGEDLTLKEVERISSGIYNICPQAKIIFGISQDKKYNGKVKITLIQAGEEKIKKSIRKKIVKKEKPLKREAVKEKKKTKKKRKEIRRSALEIKKAEKEEESEVLAQEKEWEIPAFLRKKIK